MKTENQQFSQNPQAFRTRLELLRYPDRGLNNYWILSLSSMRQPLLDYEDSILYPANQLLSPNKYLLER